MKQRLLITSALSIVLFTSCSTENFFISSDHLSDLISSGSDAVITERPAVPDQFTGSVSESVQVLLPVSDPETELTVHETEIPDAVIYSSVSADLSAVPYYTDDPYTEINGNKPYFDVFTDEYFEIYPGLDDLGRCRTAFEMLGPETMPDTQRGSIGMIRPSGWHTVQYPDIIPDKYLYNRCHLIGYQLCGKNADERNLITGTRYMNVTGMNPFEEKTASYIRRSGNHVLYRVTPVFEANELLARGVLMEALSVEDNGSGLSFCVFCYNVQPGIDIDYSDGESRISETEPEVTVNGSVISDEEEQLYILNTNTYKFHYPGCSSVSRMKDKNKLEYTGSRNGITDQGYDPCGICNP